MPIISAFRVVSSASRLDWRVSDCCSLAPIFICASMFESDRAFRLPGDDALESKPPPAPFVAPSSDSVSDRVMLNIASAAFSVSKAGASAALRSAIAIDIPKAGCASAPPKDGGAPGGAAAAPPPSGGEGSRCCTRGSRLICETRSGRPRMKSACWYRPASAPWTGGDVGVVRVSRGVRDRRGESAHLRYSVETVQVKLALEARHLRVPEVPRKDLAAELLAVVHQEGTAALAPRHDCWWPRVDQFVQFHREVHGGSHLDERPPRPGSIRARRSQCTRVPEDPRVRPQALAI
mmetsp:Transcript_543/g.1362  ORF Transcript_543/g.1362 Transcript_543/m.1362 type:complete len:292 (-) Transcript_543:139-1014(-)